MKMLMTLIAAIGLAGCGPALASEQVAPALEASRATPTASAQAGPNGVTASVDDYRLGAADKVRILIFDEPSLSGEFLVNANGKLSMPATAKVKLSPPQFEQRSRPPHTLLQGNIRTTLPSIQLPQGVKRISERALTDLVKGTVCTLAFKPQDQKIPEKDATTLILLIPIMMSTSELGSIN